MEREYRVYRIIGPDGRQYVGWTGATLQERWRNHVKRANNGEAKEHPFYNAIRKYGEDAFDIMEIQKAKTRTEAQLIEEKVIADTPETLLYNLSSGGVNDAAEGGRIFWERINANPKKKAEYLQKLSDTKKSRDWTDYEMLARANREWRKANPKEAYRQSYRAIRIANKKMGLPPPSHEKTDSRPLKERLMHKFKLNDVKSEYVTEIWANRSDEERTAIAQKIAAKQAANMSAKTVDERREITAKARAAINREKQGKAASRGLKNWWAELRKNPGEYAAYIQSRSDSRKKAKHENL